jgi:SAM-dependent methyltransferase
MSLLRNILNLPFAIIFFFVSLGALVVNLFIPKKQFARLQSRAEENEFRERASAIKPFIRKGQKVLDVGCGSGQFGKALQDFFDVKVSGIDVVDYKNAPIPVALYDGKKIPHPDRSFDLVVLAFMLHHVRHQEEILAEALRVSRGHVIIFEDVYYSPWQWLFVIWNDVYTNILFGAVRVLKGQAGKGLLAIPMPLTFRSVNGWKKVFARYPVNVVQVAVRHAPHKPHSKAVFALEVPPAVVPV